LKRSGAATFQRIQNVNNNNGCGIELMRGDSDTWGATSWSDWRISNTEHLDFGVKFTGTDITSVLHLHKNGNIGIGTDNPVVKLHVEHYGSAIGDFEGIRIANHATNLHATSRPAYEFVVSDINAGTGIGNGKFALGYRGTTSASRTDRLVIDNSGRVGIGMTSPEDKLHTDNIRIGDWSGSGNGFRFSMDTNAYLRIQYMTGQTVYKDIMALRYDTGNVGIGTTIPYAKLHVNGGSGAIDIGWRKYFKWNDPNHGGGSLAGQSGYGWGTHSIYASEAIVCGHYFVSAQGAITSSDERIKKDIVDVEDGKALDIIRELKPKKYRYKDEINRGVEPVWGFIAQEVNDILPEAVKIDEECLPNIYEMANVSTSNVITFTNFDTSTLESNASVLKVFDEDDNEHLLTIDKVIDEHSIRVKEDRTESQLFIYGQRVNDFHRIRKETVWTVATAALQEVDRQLQTTRTELSDTKEELQSEKNKVATMELLVASLVKRVGDLENLVI